MNQNSQWTEISFLQIALFKLIRKYLKLVHKIFKTKHNRLKLEQCDTTVNLGRGKN